MPVKQIASENLPEDLQVESKLTHLCSASISTPTDAGADSDEYIIEPNVLTSLRSISREMLKCLHMGSHYIHELYPRIS